MFTEKVNVQNSILFLGTARETLANLVESSSIKEKESLVNHIMNEASDYEVLYALVHEEFPASDVKYDVFDEMFLFDQLKDAMLGNYHEMCDILKEDVVTEFVSTVDTVTPFGISTALPIMEHSAKTQFAFDRLAFWQRLEGHYSRLLEQGAEDPFTAADVAIPGKEKIAQMGAEATKKAMAAANVAIEKGKKLLDAHKGKMNDLAADIDKKRQAIKKYMTAGETERADLATKALQKSNQKMKAIKGELASTQSKLKDLTAKQGQLRYHLSQVMKKGKEAVGTAAAGAVAKGTAALQAIGTKTGAAGIAKAAGLKGTAAGVAGGAGVVLAGAALAALLAWGAVKTYKRFFSKWAKMCAGKSGAEKTACMKEARSKALQAQIADLQAGLRGCADSKDPQKCSKAIAGKLTKLKGKLAKIK